MKKETKGKAKLRIHLLSTPIEHLKHISFNSNCVNIDYSHHNKYLHIVPLIVIIEI